MTALRVAVCLLYFGLFCLLVCLLFLFVDNVDGWVCGFWDSKRFTPASLVVDRSSSRLREIFELHPPLQASSFAKAPFDLLAVPRSAPHTEPKISQFLKHLQLCSAIS